MNQKLKVLYHLHAYPPYHNAGAEWMAHAMLKWLVKNGHECRVVTTSPEKFYELDGVKVYRDGFDECNENWRWCDVGLTHLVRAGKAWNWASITNKPIVYVVHNTFTNRLVEIKQDFGLIFNTQWAAEDGKKKGYNHHYEILHPPVYFNDYHTESKKRKYVTLINCWDRKGGKVLVDLAKMLPEYEFLGVKGGYGEQIIGKAKNLHYIDNTPKIRDDVYKQTRILIMPSVYESYGRTAIEALCSGIPVIASQTPGLVESLSDCGLFCPEVNDAKDLRAEPFAEQIKRLDDVNLYKKYSQAGIERAKMLDARNETEMQLIETFLNKFMQHHNQTNH